MCGRAPLIKTIKKPLNSIKHQYILKSSLSIQLQSVYLSMSFIHQNHCPLCPFSSLQNACQLLCVCSYCCEVLRVCHVIVGPNLNFYVSQRTTKISNQFNSMCKPYQAIRQSGSLIPDCARTLPQCKKTGVHPLHAQLAWSPLE